MIYAIARELDAALQAQGVPFHVVFGPESASYVTSSREHIAIEQPIDEKRDTFAPPRGAHPTPRMPLVRQQAARVRIFARAPQANARWNEHAERAEQVLDHVLAELDTIVRGRKNVLTLGAGGFVSLPDAKGSSVWSGAVYELDLAIDRGVFRRTWAGAARPTAAVGPGGVAIRSATKVSDASGAAGAPPAGAETSCGG